MPKLTVPELAALGNQLFTGQRSLDDVFEPYTVADYIEGVAMCLTLMEQRVTPQSAAQFQFRIPGTPEGPDWNHDQQHFNTPELVTHLTGSLRHWYRSLREAGLPAPAMEAPLPPPTWVTGRESPGGMGRGGRHDIDLEETLLEIRSTRDQLVAGLSQMPDEVWHSPYVSPLFGPSEMRHLVMVMGMHSAAHTIQLLEMQAHEEYPQS